MSKNDIQIKDMIKILVFLDPLWQTTGLTGEFVGFLLLHDREMDSHLKVLV